MIPSLRAVGCDNQFRDCVGTAGIPGPPLTDTLTPGTPAFHLGQRLGVLAQE